MKNTNKVVEAEIFRTSPYEGYSVSTLGNVRNDKTGRILKPGKTKLGYTIVTVGGQSRYVHQLIMDTFMPISEMATILGVSTGCVQSHLAHGGRTKDGIAFKRTSKSETRKVAA